jgi:hypothetical protein
MYDIEPEGSMCGVAPYKWFNSRHALKPFQCPTSLRAEMNFPFSSYVGANASMANGQAKLPKGSERYIIEPLSYLSCADISLAL